MLNPCSDVDIYLLNYSIAEFGWTAFAGHFRRYLYKNPQIKNFEVYYRDTGLDNLNKLIKGEQDRMIRDLEGKEITKELHKQIDLFIEKKYRTFTVDLCLHFDKYMVPKLKTKKTLKQKKNYIKGGIREMLNISKMGIV